jgi:hypothetical protein
MSLARIFWLVLCLRVKLRDTFALSTNFGLGQDNSSYMSKTFKTLTSLLFASAAAAAYVIFFWKKKMEMKGEVGKNCKNRIFTWLTKSEISRDSILQKKIVKNKITESPATSTSVSKGPCRKQFTVVNYNCSKIRWHLLKILHHFLRHFLSHEPLTLRWLGECSASWQHVCSGQWSLLFC